MGGERQGPLSLLKQVQAPSVCPLLPSAPILPPPWCHCRGHSEAPSSFPGKEEIFFFNPKCQTLAPSPLLPLDPHQPFPPLQTPTDCSKDKAAQAQGYPNQ